MFKGLMFFASMWLVMTVAGGFQLGMSTVAVTSTRLSADLTSGATTLNVRTTNGFPPVGIITIGSERVRYTSTTATTFAGLPAQALQRGWDGTTATAHSKGDTVRTVEGAMVNNAMDNKIANIADSAGIMKFFAVGDAAITMLATFFTTPFQLPADLAIVTTLWLLMGIMFFVFLGLTLVGGRRV